MAGEKTRIDFNAPTSLVERVDALADVLDTTRTRILIDALRDELDELANADEVRRLISDAFYSGQLEYTTVESILGTEEALRMKLLRDSIDREPSEPAMEDLSSTAEFYDESVSEWTPDQEPDDDAETSV